MQRVWGEYAECGESDTGKGQQACDPRKRDYAGDDGGRRQYDADLEGCRTPIRSDDTSPWQGRVLLRRAWRVRRAVRCLRRFRVRNGNAPRSSASRRSAFAPPLSWRRRLGTASLACSAAVCTVVRRMLLAWKNAQRLDASTFLAIDSVCAPLPSVSDSARHSAITAIRSAIFLFSPDACSACSACSMLSCALMIILPLRRGSTMDEQVGERKGPVGIDRRQRCPKSAGFYARGCALR